MTVIESDKSQISQPPAVVFEFLSDVRNYEKLLPQDRISDWTATETDCSFAIPGMAKINLNLSEKVPVEKIVLQSGEGSSIKFSLSMELTSATDADTTEGKIVLSADLNPFLKMMAQGPLNNLINYMVKNLEKVLSTS